MIMARMLPLAAVLVALSGTSSASGKVDDLYALRYGAKMNVLVPYDPARLVPSGSPIRLGRFAQAWSVSPDRSRFVAAAGRRSTEREPAAVQLVDLASRRVEGKVSLPGEFGRVMATAWIQGRVLVVVSGSSTTRVYAIDPDRRVRISQTEFPGVVVLGERAQGKLVLLLSAPDRIGPAWLAVVDRSPHARTVVLEEVAVGTTAAGEGADRRMRVRRPGLALAPAGGRAFVFGAGERAASVDLRTLTVRYAPLRMPAALSKQVEGSVRTAAALPDGRLVVGGFDYGANRTVGLSLVDPKDWSRRVLDPTGNWFRVAGGRVFARGQGGVGLRMLQPSGGAVDLFRTGSVANVTAVGRRAMVTFFGTGTKAAVIDLGTLRVVRHAVPARPLVGPGQPITG